jgi:methyl-accepting chemotaxis protein
MQTIVLLLQSRLTAQARPPPPRLPGSCRYSLHPQQETTVRRFTQALAIQHWKTRSKLIAGFLAVSLVGTLIGLVAIYKSSQMQALSDEMYNSSVTGLKYTAEANLALLSTGTLLRNAILALDLKTRNDSLKAAREQIEILNTSLRLASQKFSDPEGQAKVAETLAVVEEFTLNASKVMEMIDSEFIGASHGSRVYLMAVMQKQTQQSEDGLSQLMRLKSDRAAAMSQASSQLYTEQLLTLLATTALALLTSLLIGLALTRNLTRLIGGEPSFVAALARQIASGDLLTRIDARRASPASVVHAMAEMQAALIELVNGVRHASDSIATGAQQVASGNADLSERTEQQASNLEETAATMEQLSTTVKLNSEAAQHATGLAQASRDAAAAGSALVGQVVSTMADIKGSSHRISDIIGVIDGIAFQTNILALNAAVEAARAGDQGRGFAVVAGEVRTLAQRSAAAAKEIKSLIQASENQVIAGNELVAQAGKSIDGIMSRIRQLAELMVDINAASQEQTTGIRQVGDAIAQIDNVTQHNAALVQESAAAADNLSAQAQYLVRQVAAFKTPDQALPNSPR